MTVKPFCLSPICEKCGSYVVQRTYHAKAELGCYGHVCHQTDSEHHLMHCTACHFEWVEGIISEQQLRFRNYVTVAMFRGVPLEVTAHGEELPADEAAP